MKSILYAVLLLTCSVVAAFAQQSAPPSEIEEANARAAAAEAQSTYLMTHIRRQQMLDAAQRQADIKKADDLAAYWAEVWKALPEK